MYILAMIGFFNACEGPLVLTGGGPANATRPVLLYAYMEATGGKGDYAYAVTIATLVFFVVLILTALVQRISSKD